MYPPHHLGGYELSCRDVVERWRARGHAVEVLTTSMRVDGVEDPPDERAGGVHRDLGFYYANGLITKPSAGKRFAIERHNHEVLLRTLDAVRPDVVSVWHMGAMSQGLLTTIEERGVPMAFSICDDWLEYGPRVDPWMKLFIDRPAAGRVVQAITGLPTRLPRLGSTQPFCFNSDWVKRRAMERSRYEIATSTVVYSGIDPGDFPVVETQRPPWRWRLLCVGRQEERKGTHVAIAALAGLPSDATLEIVGPGDTGYLRRLHELAADPAVVGRVGFDKVERSALRERYAAADAFVFPVTWDEPFGLVPVEAMACGVPVIATGTGGSAEFLVDGLNCLLVPKNDAAAIASAVRRLASDPALRDRLGAGGYATARELSIDRLADALEAWHEAAATRFTSGRPADLPVPLAALRAR